MTDAPETDEDQDDQETDEAGPDVGPGYDTIDAAFGDWSTSVANQVFLRRLLAGIDVQRYVLRRGYLKVVRASGEPALQVHLGYTNGFRSAEEIAGAVDGVKPWISQRRRDTWGVTHPDHGSSRGEGERRAEVRDGGRCPTCGDVMPMTGVCDFCG